MNELMNQAFASLVQSAQNPRGLIHGFALFLLRIASENKDVTWIDNPYWREDEDGLTGDLEFLLPRLATMTRSINKIEKTELVAYRSLFMGRQTVDFSLIVSLEDAMRWVPTEITQLLRRTKVLGLIVSFETQPQKTVVVPIIYVVVPGFGEDGSPGFLISDSYARSYIQHGLNILCVKDNVKNWSMDEIIESLFVQSRFAMRAVSYKMLDMEKEAENTAAALLDKIMLKEGK